MSDSTHYPETPENQPGSADTRPMETSSPHDAAPPVAQDPLATASPAQPGPPAATRPPVRMSTVVWGAIIVVVGAGVVARALGADFDNQLALIVLLAVSGVALVATSIVSAVRRR